MISGILIEQLQKLSRSEKLRIVQILVEQLAEDEPFDLATEYEVWSPYDSPGAAMILSQMLEDEAKNA
jgi:hypothetical protein